MFNFSTLSREVYPLSDLETLLLKDSITEDDILQIPQLFPEEQRNSPNETPLTHDFENLSITPTDKATTPLNERPRKRKSTIPSRQSFKKQRKSEEATSYYSFTKNPQLKINLTYKLKERSFNQWRIVFWISNDKNLPAKTHQSVFNEYLFPSDQSQPSINYVPTFTKGKI